MSSCADARGGPPRHKERASPPRRVQKTALPPPGVREKTRTTVTACVENYCRRVPLSADVPAATCFFGFTVRCPSAARLFYC